MTPGGVNILSRANRDAMAIFRFPLNPPPMTDTSALDPQAMRAAVRAFPDHLATGWDAAAVVDTLPLYDAVDGVVVCGMGGSAIGGDIVRALAETDAPVPFVVNRGYTLPSWVGPRTLVVASSYSGGTEETLSAHAEATWRGARIVIVSSGGEISERAATAEQPLVTIPGGMQPRAALGYSLGALLRLATAAGLLRLTEGEFRDAVDAARARAARYDADAGSRVASEANAAHGLAGRWAGALPVVYTAAGLMEPVGMRWRTQIHENAKHPAVGNVFPELNHNEIMAFESGPEELLRRMQVVVLRDADDHSQVQKRYDATRSLVEGVVGGWTEVESDGDTRLARVLSLVQLGDAASFWLAMAKGVDPTPVETIQALKRQLVD